MAEILLITPQEITDTTILGGNVDVDKYKFCILDTQVRVIEPLLGTLLYKYILTNRATLTGEYLTLFNDYVKPILKFSTVANYLEIASFMVDNGGIFKHTAENKDIPSMQEVTALVQKYNSLCDMYILRFDKWNGKNNIPEYGRCQNPKISTKIGWRL